MDKFLKRTITSIILVVSVYFVIYVFPNWMFCLVTAGFIFLGLHEFFKMVERRNVFVYKYFGIVVGCLIPVVAYTGDILPDLKNLDTILIMVACLFAFVLQFTRKDETHDHLVSIAITLFSLLYIAWFFSFFVKIKALSNGANLVAFLIMVTKGADMGAYLVGSFIGKKELIPRISPKKTREGTLGGIIISVILALLFGRYFTNFSFIHLFALSLILSVLGQIGDLAESLLKRDCEIKDSGEAVVGIGGVLDLIDSLLFTAPVFYFYIKTF